MLPLPARSLLPAKRLHSEKKIGRVSFKKGVTIMINYRKRMNELLIDSRLSQMRGQF